MAGGALGQVVEDGGLGWGGAGEVIPEQDEPGMFLIRRKGHIRLLRFGAIDWVGAEGNYSSIYVGEVAHLVRRGIGELEQRLGSSGFARVSRSAIVNLDRIERLVPWFNGGYVVHLTTGKELRLSRRYAQDLFRRIGRPL